MTMRVTITSTVMGESGSLLTAGSTYSVSDSFGSSLVNSGRATDTDRALNPQQSELKPYLATDASNNVTGLVGPGGVSVTGKSNVIGLYPSVNVLDFYANGVSGALVDSSGVLDSTLGIQAAFNALKLQGGGKLVFPPGTYKITNRIFIQGLTNAVITGPGATITKSGFDYTGGGNPIFYFLEGQFIQVKELRFIGSQPSTTDVLYGDDGILSVDCVEIDISHNEFTDFGDGAIRNLSHYVTNPPTSVIAFNVHIAFNFFNNILQTSSTPGGVDTVTFVGNTFSNLKGSVKFASRVANSGRIVVANNVIKTGLGTGFEFSSTGIVLIANNVVTDAPIMANFYTNPAVGANPATWDNLVITDNLFSGCTTGVRIASTNYNDGTRVCVNNVTISGNTFRGVTGGSNDAAILLTGTISNARILNNSIFTYTSNGIYLTLDPRVALNARDNILIQGNQLTAGSGANAKWVNLTTSGAPTRKVIGVTIANNVSYDSAGSNLLNTTDLKLIGNISYEVVNSVWGQSGVTLDSCVIANNQITSTNAGPNCLLVGAKIFDNIFDGAVTYGFRIDGSSSALEARGNVFPTLAPTWNVASTGRWSLGVAAYQSGTAAPSTGSAKVGDRCINTAAAVGQPKGWICTVAGSPGTWVSEGNL